MYVWWVMRCWCGYLSGARCRLFAYGPADATAIPKPHNLLPPLSRLVSPFWYWLTQVVLENRPLNGCNSSSTTCTSNQRQSPHEPGSAGQPLGPAPLPIPEKNPCGLVWIGFSTGQRYVCRQTDKVIIIHCCPSRTEMIRATGQWSRVVDSRLVKEWLTDTTLAVLSYLGFYRHQDSVSRVVTSQYSGCPL